MSSFDPSRIPAWLAPVWEERSVSHSTRWCDPSWSQRPISGALPFRMARCSTGSARPSISRKTTPGTSVSSRSPERRAMRWITLNVYVSSSFVPRTMSSTTPIAAAASATPSADQNESTVRSPSVIASAASSISASTTSTSRNPSSAMNGRRSAATAGGRTAFSAAITAAATSAEPKFLTSAPGTIQAAASRARAESTHETSRRNTWNRGRRTSHSGRSPYACTLAITPDPPRAAAGPRHPYGTKCASCGPGDARTGGSREAGCK